MSEEAACEDPHATQAQNYFSVRVHVISATSARFYSSGPAFHRLLRLLSNEVMSKARDLVGQDALSCPEEVWLASLHFMIRLIRIR